MTASVFALTLCWAAIIRSGDMTAMPRCACENHCAVLMANYWMRRKPLGIHPVRYLSLELVYLFQYKYKYQYRI